MSSPINPHEQIAGLKAAIAALNGQRTMLGQDVVNSSLAPLRRQLKELEKLTDADEQQRRQVTVLFADVSGFTAMSEVLDSEDVAEIMNALWQRIDVVITSHGGRITQHVGDCVMALWGAERVREDDAECAVRAALKMQAELAQFRTDRGVGLEMRIGLHTGPVLLGSVGTTREFTALGDTVNTASRLEHAAPVSGILISHETYRHLAGFFEVSPEAPLLVKGKIAPIQTYVVLRVMSRAHRLVRRGVEGIRTPMVARERELARLRERLQQAIGQRAGGLVSIIGEVGVGKSRLLDEFTGLVRSLPEAPQLFVGRCDRGLQTIPFGLLRDVLSHRFGIQDDDVPAEVRRKVESGVGEMLAGFTGAASTPFFPATTSRSTIEALRGGGVIGPSRAESVELRAHLIGHLLGFDFSESPHLRGALGDGLQLKNRALSYLATAWQTLAQRVPVVVCVEDIHWADDSSLAALIRFGQAAPGHRLLFVCAARPDLLSRRRDWAANEGFHTRLDLAVLSPEESRKLVDGILHQVPEVPEVLREMIVRQADGNPYYVEELVKMLLEEGTSLSDEKQWEVEASRLAAKVPPTLTAVLQARFDSLHPAEKLALQRASIIGRVFWDHAVASLDGDPAGEETASFSRAPIDIGVLDLLRSREIISSHASSGFSDANEYSFKHVLLRDVTYDTVLKRDRRRYHDLVASWLTAHCGGRVGEIAGVIADHLERAGLHEQAALRLGQAGEHAFQLSAFHESKAFFERGLTLLPGNGPDRLAMKVRLGEVLLRLGDYAAARQLLDDCAVEARAKDALTSLASALSFLGILALHQGRMAESKQFVKESLAVARRSLDQAGVAHALIELGWANLRIGDPREAKPCFEESLERFGAIDDQKGVARALGGLGVVAEKLGDFPEAQKRGLESLAIFRDMGSRQGMSVVYNNLGELARSQGDYSGAVTFYRDSLTLAHAIDDRRSVAIALGNLGHAAVAQADHAAAQTAYLEAMQTAMAIQVVPWVLDSLAGLAGVMVRTGRAESALRFLGMIVHHPALYSDTKPVIEPILVQLRGQFSPAYVEAQLEAGRERRLEDVVSEVLSGTARLEFP